MTAEPHIAALDGFEVGSHLGRVDYPGLIFQVGVEPKVPHHLMRTTPSFLDIGNYQYTIRAGKNSFTYVYGFVAIKLDRMMPHMVLDATQNDFLGATTLPVGFNRNQVLSLEGDFDQHFTLYCPKRYERDALYVFTPDLMALLIDEAGVVDVEVIDDWVFLYRYGGFTLSDEATVSRLFRIIDTVGAKLRSRSDTYADSRMNGADAGDRLSLNEVSAAGVRLKKAMPGALKVGVIVCSVVIGGALLISVWAAIAQML